MNNKTWHLSNTVISKQTSIDNNWKRQTIPSIDCRNRWIWTLSKGEKHHHLRLKNKRNWHLFPENVQLGKTLENKKWNHYKSRWSETKTGGCTMIYTAIIIWLVTHWKLQCVTNLKLSSHDLIACRCFSVWKFDQRGPTELLPFADVPGRNVRSLYDLRHPGQKSVPANASANQPPSYRGWYDLGLAKARLRTVYIAAQRRVAEYAAAAWIPWLSSSNIVKLERTQLQAARASTNHVRSTPTEAVLYEADLYRLEHRFKTLSVLQANKWNSLVVEDQRRVVMNDSVRLRLRRPDWRTTVLAALSSLGVQTFHPGDHSPPRPDPPWSRPPPAPTAMTDVSKSMSRDQQLAATLAAMDDTGPNDIQLYTDGSTHEGTTYGGAGMVDMSGEDIIKRWHAPTGRWSSSYQAEKSAIVRAISWLDEYEDWQSAHLLCVSKSLVETLANSYQPDGDVHRIQSAIVIRCPAFMTERERLGLGRAFDELVRLPCASLAQLKIIFRRLRWLQQQQSGGRLYQWPFVRYIELKFHNNGRQTALWTETNTKL